MQKQKSTFNVNGTELTGFFLLPDGFEGKLPLVVMANGFATEWQFGTEGFIQAVTDSGIAAFVFDYRFFGQSAGEPRQVLSTNDQLEDFKAAIDHAIGFDFIDAERFAIWGSSLGGGHAITMAGKFPNAKALVAQVPHCCSRAAFKEVSLSSILKGMSFAIADSLKSLVGGVPIEIPIVQNPDKYAVMNHTGWKESYLKIAADSPTWKNSIPARSLLKAGDYRPILSAPNIKCPALIVAGRHDAGVPFQAVVETVENMPNGELYAYDGEHFDVYYGDKMPAIVEKEVTFLNEHLSK